jgi:RimJ/RimL family protein N-acetyltransferase
LLVGLLTFLPQNTVCWECHIVLLPRRKTHGHVILRGALDWMFEHTTAQRIVGAVPGYNRLAVQVAKRAGMTQYGTNPRSFMKHGKLEDQVLFGLSKGDICLPS